MVKNTIDLEELEKFSSLSEEWWNPLGKLRPLHEINPIRIDFIKKHVQSYYNLQEAKNLFQGLSFLDIGCGGGILSEPLARLGGDVTSIDPSEKNIKTAIFHASQNNIKVNYKVATVEELTAEKLDVVLNMEVIEHVADIDLFIEKSCRVVKDNGLMFLSTLNRTLKSYLLSIIGAEYILRWLPKGTHQWKKFICPHEIERKLRSNNFQTIEYKGIEFNCLSQQWDITEKLDVNYMVVARKC